ncbi:GH25 family lysozyme [Rugosimonospora africana]|uniref:Lysozyme n=1 Tax=Rugosimonospora africana TaxID=556532 RepID=A0A8J3QQN3_9ACTN|nr:GH25 family lysozyme [Rugosimonospora africana]GIH14002.1 lysozyme [Rugosimonospora africana]
MFLAPLVSTRRRKRAVVLGLTAVLSPVWGTAGTPVTDLGNRPPAVVVNPTTVAAIRSGRPTGYPIGGIDISGHDHQRFGVQWATEAAAGSQFVYVKATEGTTYVNPYFVRDSADARAAGRYVGAYVYARPDRGNPIGQAEFFLRHIQRVRDGRTLVPFVDLEWPYAAVKTNSCYNLNPAQLRAWIHAFIGRLEAGIGRKPMIYTNAHWWDPCTGNDASFGRYPLDLSNYTKKPPTLPAGWTTFALWQYAPGNPSKRDDHDRDVVNGGMAGLKKLVWPPPRAQR